uniref:Uncharacterized protein n=1 Tax=Moniliophthora roreri TaxID=221103 RepID=A0A0W0ETQ2_MONRR
MSDYQIVKQERAVPLAGLEHYGNVWRKEWLFGITLQPILLTRIPNSGIYGVASRGQKTEASSSSFPRIIARDKGKSVLSFVGNSRGWHE